MDTPQTFSALGGSEKLRDLLEGLRDTGCKWASEVWNIVPDPFFDHHEHMVEILVDSDKYVDKMVYITVNENKTMTMSEDG